MIRNIFLSFLSVYQKFFSLLSFGSCRFYPSCSEYAKWQFEQNPLYYAFFSTIFRILRCNQFCKGGIDYPILHNLSKQPSNLTLDTIKYWLIPKSQHRFYMIKNFTFKG
ncbi:MAG: membrane protein insertion efficiency factor YidD [Sulfurimonas sp.]|nr:MAG: membrane protein insertion efficiency factor YidD [Sulfurimonas sp.]